VTPLDDSKRLNSPPLQGRGRGWGLSANTIAELQARAAEMRRNPTEPEKRLWRILCNAQLADSKFRRQAVVPPFIADFLCPRAALIVEVDGDSHDAGKDRVRDDLMVQRGYRTVRVTNAEVMTNLEGVAHAIRDALAATPQPNPSPEGEGL